MTSDIDLRVAQMIRDEVGPLRRPDGRIDASAVAREVSLRELEGLPSWIAELDAPRNGLDHMEGQDQGEDQQRDPGDTMPAQGWLSPRYDGPHVFQCMASWSPSGVCSDPGCGCPCHHPDYTDAGRLPAPRKDSTMAHPIPEAEVRESFDHAAERASTVAQFATMEPDQRVAELDQRPVRELLELHHAASATEAWHRQGVKDAQALSRNIGEMLRFVADQIDPQAKTMAEQGVIR